MKRHNIIISFILIITCLTSCSNYAPKPIGYFRIDLPEKHYTKFENPKYPFSFEYPDSICKIVEKPARKGDEYGLNIIYPSLRGCIYCDYKPVKGNFRAISEDLRSFVYKHTAKADAITEQPYVNKDKKVYGVLYELEGNTASQVQFVLTDSTKHIFRGALYFNVSPNADSLAPVTKYVNDDIVKLIDTFNWKD